MAKVFHLYTQEGHTLIFRDDEDFTVGWNALVIAAYLAGVTIYCFCLMSNHIHVLVQGEEQNIEDFFLRYKRLVSRHLSQKYSSSNLMGWEMALTEINDRTAFTQEIAYILRNPLKANINTPWNYRWSSIMAYFQTDKGRGQAISDISKRILWQLLKSRVSLPENYRIENGLITLDSFINSSAVEKRFMESPIEYYRMITKWSLESIVEERNGKEIVDSYSDADILDYMKSAYGVTNPQGLESKRMMRYIRDIRNRFGASRKQLIRLFAIDEVLLDKLL